MVFNIVVKVALGQRHEVRVTNEDGIIRYRSVRAVYECTNYRVLGYIEKRPTRGVWEAFNGDARTIGQYTSRESAIHYIIRHAIQGY